ncbi:MAG: hypothetical protein JWM20_518 [Patescibacteria group bacterium]|nr:hypothetical protein [Patescibacteria group bacterium]
MEDTPKPILTDNRPFRPKHLTIDDIRAGCVKLHGENGVETEICVSDEELRQGLDFVEHLEKSITIFGSARTLQGDKYYEKAVRVAHRAVKECGCAVITGGGPGIMQAGNQGAYEANGKSIGMQIILPHEQVTNPYLTDVIPFYFFYNRKTVMRYASEVYLFFPGGFGTLDELSESLTLVQTGKIANVKLILVGVEFWKPFQTFVEERLVPQALVSPTDVNLYTITDDEDEIAEIIRNAPKREKN